MPFGSVAQSEVRGISGASFTPDLAFQGIAQSPILTSGIKYPSLSGSDHGQQNPAVSLALLPAASLSRIIDSNSCTLSAILKSKSSASHESTLESRVPSVLS